MLLQLFTVDMKMFDMVSLSPLVGSMASVQQVLPSYGQ